LPSGFAATVDRPFHGTTVQDCPESRVEAQ
jgi:hypothetical protein